MYSLDSSERIDTKSFSLDSAHVSLRDNDYLMFDLFRRITNKSSDLPKNGNKPATSNYEYLEKRLSHAKLIEDSNEDSTNISHQEAFS